MPRRTTFTGRLAPVTIAIVSMLIVPRTSPTAMGSGNSFVSRNVRESGPGIANHPVGMIPSAAVTVPSDWPLDSTGAMTCLTCHAEIPAGVGQSGPKLRDFEFATTQPIEFCARCHGQPDSRSGSSVHWLAVGVAHVSTELASVARSGRVLDANTRQCLSCHDGATASQSKNATPWNRARGDTRDTGRNHPVGVTYDDISRSKDLSPLRPAGLLPQEVVLPEGKVACISCHDLYAHERYRLTITIQGSELCLTCHDMR